MNAVHLAQLDLNLLVVLHELLATRSTTLTARRLARTQSAVSHSLRKLRELLKDPLLVRSGSTLVLTERAEALRGPVSEVLAGAESLFSKSAAKLDPSRLERVFVLAGTDFSELVIMPQLIPVLQREAPGVEVRCRYFADDIDRAIQAREVDVGFGTRFRELPGVLEQKLFDDHLVCVVRKGHPVGKSIDLERFLSLDHVLVAPRGMPGSPIDSALESLGVRRRVVLTLPHFLPAMMTVAKTDLVVSMPGRFALGMTELFDVQVMPLPLDVAPFRFVLAFAESVRDDPAQRWFRSKVAKAAMSSSGLLERSQNDAKAAAHETVNVTRVSRDRRRRTVVIAAER
ncbi:MAG: LysR family transcriptional regulator [Polyangiaceae bacterium]